MGDSESSTSALREQWVRGLTPLRVRDVEVLVERDWPLVDEWCECASIPPLPPAQVYRIRAVLGALVRLEDVLSSADLEDEDAAPWSEPMQGSGTEAPEVFRIEMGFNVRGRCGFNWRWFGFAWDRDWVLVVENDFHRSALPMPWGLVRATDLGRGTAVLARDRAVEGMTTWGWDPWPFDEIYCGGLPDEEAYRVLLGMCHLDHDVLLSNAVQDAPVQDALPGGVSFQAFRELLAAPKWEVGPDPGIRKHWPWKA